MSEKGPFVLNQIHKFKGNFTKHFLKKEKRERVLLKHKLNKIK